MNIAFAALSLVSLILLTMLSPSTAFPTMIRGVNNAILLVLKLTAIYAVWLSVLKMAQSVGADKKLSRFLKPFAKKMFKNESDEAYDWICVNLASNMLGMGGVATPAGIRAINNMACDGDKASNNMITLLVINATSIQLIPATIIAIRAAAGSKDPTSIFLPTLLSSAIATVCGVIMCKVLALKKDMPTRKNKCLSRKNRNINTSLHNKSNKYRIVKNK